MLSESHARTLGAHVGDRIPLVAFTPAESQRCLFSDGNGSPECRRIFRTPRLSRARRRDHPHRERRQQPRERHQHLDAERRVLRAASRRCRMEPDRRRPSPSRRVRRVVRDRRPPRRCRAGRRSRVRPPERGPVFDAVDVLATGLALFALVAGLAGAFAVGRPSRARSAPTTTNGACSRRSERRARACTPTRSPRCSSPRWLGVVLALLATYVASAWMPIGFARRVDPARGRELDGVDGRSRGSRSLSCADRGGDASARCGRRAACGRPPPVARGSPGSSRHRRDTGGRGRVAERVLAGARPPGGADPFGVHRRRGRDRGHRRRARLQRRPRPPRARSRALRLELRRQRDQHRVREARGRRPRGRRRRRRPYRRARAGERSPDVRQVFAPIEGDGGPAIAAGRAPVARDEIALGADTMAAAHTGIGGTVAVAGAGGQARDARGRAGRVPDRRRRVPVGRRRGGHARPRSRRSARAIRRTCSRCGSGPASTGPPRSHGWTRSTPRTIPSADPPERPAPPAEVEKLRQVESLPQDPRGVPRARSASIALAHALVVGARRRARDFAVLRALGFRRRNVRAAVSWEAGALGVRGRRDRDPARASSSPGWRGREPPRASGCSSCSAPRSPSCW